MPPRKKTGVLPPAAPTKNPFYMAQLPGSTSDQEGEVVSRAPARPKVTTGKPRKITGSTMRLGYSGGGFMGGSTMDASAGNFYSPELSTDFLEQPQSQYEQWNYYRFFARKNPFVKQALGLHTELPLSKIRLNVPAAKDRDMALAATKFCEKWAKKVGLLRKLMGIVRDYYLIGVVNIFCEDDSPDMPDELLYETEGVLGDDGELTEVRKEREDKTEAVKWLKKNYYGWTSLRVLPPEQVHAESFNFTDEKILELIPDGKTKRIIQQAEAGDPNAIRIVESMPSDVVAAVRAGRNIPLNTDPDAGSFVYVMENDKSDYEATGHSVLECCLPTLINWDKLRQANASIASRHMTPIRVVWVENMDAKDTEDLRAQVDMALQDPDFSIISNKQINWEEMGSDSRLLDLTSEMEMTNRELYAGLGVTEGLLTGESSYSGDKISLEVINTRYMLLRELLQDFVEQYLFEPMCRRMGFIEEDEDGNEVVIHPKLTFTRLAVRDNQETFDAFLNLYQKGSLDVDTILELLNLDPVAIKEKIERDLFTVNDPVFNEVMRGIYSGAGSKLVDESDVVAKIAKALGVKLTPPKEEGRY